MIKYGWLPWLLTGTEWCLAARAKACAPLRAFNYTSLKSYYRVPSKMFRGKKTCMYEKETHVVRLLGLEEMGGASNGTK